MKTLMVLTSHDTLGNSGKKTGFWLEEFAAPYYVFRDAGAEVTVASPKGGQPPIDPKSGSVTLVSTPGHTPGSQSLLVHLKHSGFIILSGDVVHLEENFVKNRVPSLNTDNALLVASMSRVRRLLTKYNATLFTNHDKAQTDKLKFLPAFYD